MSRFFKALRASFGSHRTLHVVFLALVLAAVATVLFFFASRKGLNYDEYWHVFIARQDIWQNFWWEVFGNAHPPLFFLLLRLAIFSFGLNFVAYQLVSILSMVVSVWLLAAIVHGTTSNWRLAAMAAGAFGLSFNAVTMGLEVRAYSLCTALSLAACVFYLNWLKAPTRHLSKSTYFGFAFMLTAAILTHYSAFFFTAATIAAPVILAMVDSKWRRRLLGKVSARRAATAMMFGVPVAVGGAAYFFHAIRWTGGLWHVGEFMFNSAVETRVEFLARNTVNLARLLLPGWGEAPITRAAFHHVGVQNWQEWVSLLAVGGIWAVGLTRLFRSRALRLGTLVVVMLLVMTALNAAAGLAARYPYGGQLRQEFFLVPFAVASFFTLVEAVRRRIQPRFAWHSLWLPAVALGVFASVLSWITLFTPLSPQWRSLQPQMNRFTELLGPPEVVLVDRYNFINFFSYHQDWHWSTFHQVDTWQVWLVTQEGRSMKVCRDRYGQLDMSSPRTYGSAMKCLEDTGADRVAVFRPQMPGSQANWDASKTSSLMGSLSKQAGLTQTFLDEDGGDVYAEFAVLDRQPAVGPIRVVRATYGASCQAEAGNVTAVVGRYCDGKSECSFFVDYRVLGDPSPRCAKDFIVQWQCEGDAHLHQLTLPAEAGFGSVALLRCASAAVDSDSR